MLDGWSWLSFLGGLAQIAGLLVAMRGVQRLKADAFPNEPSPAATLARRAGDFVWHHILRRSRSPGVIQASSTAIRSRVGTPLVTAPPQRPPDTATVGELLDYIESVRDLEVQKREHSVDELNRRCDRLRDRISLNERSTDDRFANQEERLTLALGGRDGRGLDITWLGLVIAALGLAGQGAAILLA